MFTHWEAFPTPYFWDFMEASSCRHCWSLAPVSAFLPSQENRGRSWKCQAYNHGLIFPVTVLIQKPTQSLLIRTKYIFITRRMTEISEVLCQELGSESYTIYCVYFPLFHNVYLVLTLSLCVPYHFYLFLRTGNKSALLLYSWYYTGTWKMLNQYPWNLWKCHIYKDIYHLHKEHLSGSR